MAILIFLIATGLMVAQPVPLDSIPGSENWTRSPEYTEVENTSFGPGEELEFKATFGWFTVGKAVMKVDRRLHEMNDRTCYKIEVVGKTSGVVDWVVNVDDYWGAYVDTASMVSQKFTRRIKEGSYRKREITEFDHVNDSLVVHEWSFSREEWYEPVRYPSPDNIRDMISGYFFLRTLDFSILDVGDTINVKGFFEDTFYDLSVIYEGKEKLRTKAGVFNTVKLVPVMPANSLFDGRDSVATWISDDDNKIPIKVSAKMFIGNAGVELVGFKNLKHPPNLR